MKDIKDYLLESTNNKSTKDEDLESEVGLALKPFGSIKNGFQMADIDDIKDAMYKIEFDFDEERSDDETLVFTGEYIDTKYDVILYAKDHVSGRFKIHNFQVFEV